MKSLRILALALLLAPSAAFAEDEPSAEKPSVLNSGELEFGDEQRAQLSASIEAELTSALKSCVATYERPEFFNAVLVDYTLKKSGRLSGGYVGGASPDPGIYVKDDAERAKLEEKGAFARLVVRNDRDLERCMKKATGKANSGLQRFAASIKANFAIDWQGKAPTVKATQFEVVREK